MKKEHFCRQVNLACQGLITRNNNALELAHHFIPKGNLLLSRLQRYASFLSESAQGSPGQGQDQAGKFLIYLLPFLTAFGASDQRIEEYSTVSISLMPGARKFLDRAQAATIPCFLISSAYRPFIQSVSHLFGFREPWVYYTPLNLDQCSVNESEREILKDLADEIIKMPLLTWKKEQCLPLSLQAQRGKGAEGQRGKDNCFVPVCLCPPEPLIKEIIPEHIPYRQRLQIIFEEEIADMQIGKAVAQVTALAGNEKVKAIIDSLEKTGNPSQGVLYLGCSVLDAAALDWVRKAGGLAVSFNGDQAAVRSAEVAVMSGTSIILAIISDTFFQQGKEGVLELVKNWDLHKIQTGTLKIHPSLMNELFSHEAESFPQLELVRSSKGLAKWGQI